MFTKMAQPKHSLLGSGPRPASLRWGRLLLLEEQKEFDWKLLVEKE